MLDFLKEDLENRAEKAVARWIEETSENDELLYQEVKKILDSKKQKIIMEGIGVKLDRWGHIESIDCPAFKKVLEDEKIQPKIEKWYRTNIQAVLRRTISKILEQKIDEWTVKAARDQFYNYITREIDKQLNPVGIAQEITKKINDCYLKLKGEQND